ncbi:hypothetical protein HOC37_05090 [bacterium]|jgi:hypothetical protein|nr:hypothetical protein [bacterium]MBT3581248.1 hypothetical protein [bacterium]MBT4552337.1 hypothetical protein [bacterium]MBT5988969.1 hypothetical protein [bacterium]MBT7088389.1 hypothetical protein [bacterium]
MKKSLKNNLQKIEGVIYLEGLVFINPKLFKSHHPIVQETFENIYKFITKN